MRNDQRIPLEVATERSVVDEDALLELSSSAAGYFDRENPMVIRLCWHSESDKVTASTKERTK